MSHYNIEDNRLNTWNIDKHFERNGNWYFIQFFWKQRERKLKIWNIWTISSKSPFVFYSKNDLLVYWTRTKFMTSSWNLKLIVESLTGNRTSIPSRCLLESNQPAASSTISTHCAKVREWIISFVVNSSCANRQTLVQYTHVLF